MNNNDQNKALRTFKFQGLDPIFPIIEVQGADYDDAYNKVMIKLAELKSTVYPIDNKSEVKETKEIKKKVIK